MRAARYRLIGHATRLPTLTQAEKAISQRRKMLPHYQRRSKMPEFITGRPYLDIFDGRASFPEAREFLDTANRQLDYARFCLDILFPHYHSPCRRCHWYL